MINRLHELASLISAAARLSWILAQAAAHTARLYLLKLYVHYFAHVSLRAKCPACGVCKKHQIAYSDIYQRVLHQCTTCRAAWSDAPVVAADQWQLKLEADMKPVELKPE